MKELKEDGREYVDGTPVDFYEGKFVGIFPMSEDIASPICEGDQFTFMVTVRTDIPKFSRVRKTGEMKRINNFQVEETVLLDRDKAAVMYDSLGLSVAGVNDGFIELDPDEDEADAEEGILEFDAEDIGGGMLFDFDLEDEELLS